MISKILTAVDSNQQKLDQNAFRWGIVGLGRLATQRIVPAMRKLNRSVLVGGIGSNPERNRWFAEEFKTEAVFEGYGDLLTKGRLNAIYIAAPNALHPDLVKDAASKKINVFCEKPLALNRTEAAAAVATCESANVLLKIGFQLRFEKILKRIREIVLSGELGELRNFQLSRIAGPGFVKQKWRDDPAEGGVIYDLLVHLLDLTEWICDREILSVSALSHPDRRAGIAEDNLIVLGNLGNGCTMILKSSREIPFGQNDLIIEGVRGMLQTGPLRSKDEFVLTVQTSEGTREERFKATAIFEEALKAFEGEMAGASCRTLADGQDGIRNVQLTEAVLSALAKGTSVKV